MCRERGTLLHCWWECKLVQPLWKIVWRFLQKLKAENYHMIQQFHSWVYIQRKWKTLIQEGTFIPIFTAALFTIAIIWKQPRCPSTDKWIKKMWCVYIYIYIYTHTYIYIRTYMYMYTYIYIHIHTYMCIYIYTYTHCNITQP